MTLSRRHILALGGGLASAGLLTACGANTGRTDVPTATPSSTAASGPRPQLAQWYHKYGEEGVEDAVKAWAAEYPDADVNVTWTLADYEKALAAALLTPTAPDVFEYGNGPTLDMIRAGQVADLTDLLGDARADFAAPVLQRMTHEGAVWAIPQTIDMQLLYYRPSLLSDAGVQPPRTLEELVDAAKALATNDRGGFFAGNDGGLGVLGSLLVWSSGLEQFNDDRTEVGWNDEAMFATALAYRDLFASDALVKAASDDWYSVSALVNGETAMQWGGLWDLPKVTEAFGDDVGVLPFPAAGASGRQAVPFGAFSACVHARSEQVDAAKAFVKWLWVDSTEKQVEFSNAFGTHIPARTSLFGRADKVATGPGADAARFVNELGHTNDLFWSSAISDAFSGALSSVVKGGGDPAKEFGAAATKAQAELTRLKG